jgi:hypothetical protein
MPVLPIERVIKMLQALLAGEDVKAVTPEEKRCKASLMKDIKRAEKEGWQIEIPNV